MQARSGTLLFSAYTHRVSWTGERIREARGRRGWTQAALAAQLGAGVRTVASWERDEAKPQAQWIVRLNDVLGGDEPTDDTTSAALDAHIITAALQQADFLQLLAEMARRYAQATHGAAADTQPAAPAGRYKIFTADAPTPEHPAAPEQGSGRDGETGSQGL